jgi:hypothetical protein
LYIQLEATKSLSFVSAIKRQRQDIPDGDRGIILNFQNHVYVILDRKQ